MERAVNILIVMEMLAVNLFTVDICSHRKYSGRRTIASLFLFTVVLTSITDSWWEPMGFNQGNASFAVIGVVYLIPLSLLYFGPVLRVSGILFSAWLYTLFVYCLAVRMAYAMPGGTLTGRVALVQSFIYIITLYPFLRWVKNGFLFVIHNANHKNLCILQAVSLCWFGTVILVNGLFLHPDNYWMQFSVMTAMAVNIILSYMLIVSMFKSLSEVKTLRDIVYIDPLTGIYNREKLFQDAEMLIKKKKPFRLIFMDLNHFKAVNDQYGHQTGDRYLAAFAHTTKEMLGEGDTIYRISGDEFIIISQAKDYQKLTDKLLSYPKTIVNMEFYGCGIGWADYPAEESEVDTLVALADQRMYRDKQLRH